MKKFFESAGFNILLVFIGGFIATMASYAVDAYEYSYGATLKIEELSSIGITLSACRAAIAAGVILLGYGLVKLINKATD